MHTVHFSVYVFQVVTLRVVHEKLLCLLPGAKQQALTVERVFEPFSGLNPLHYNPYTEVRYKELHVSVYLVSVIYMQLLWIVVAVQVNHWYLSLLKNHSLNHIYH